MKYIITELVKYKQAALILLLITMTQQMLMAQTKAVIVDKSTREPISFVSIYAKNGKSILGTVSDEFGKFEIKFPFHSLFFSHINYSKIEINKDKINDTIYLTPITILLNEVVITNKQPQWIKKILYDVVKQKNKNYQNTTQKMSYNYNTYTLADSSGYAFQSKGFLEVPLSSKNENFRIVAADNMVQFKDRTAGPDFMNLRRMLYDDFIKKFDHKFINKCTFKENHLFENKDLNLVQLIFKSENHKDDNGYMIIDTLNKVIVEFERKSGTEFNVKNQTSILYRNYAALAGFHYNEWQTLIRIKYSKMNGSYQLSDCKYKFYMKSTNKRNKINQTYFSSTESQLKLVKTERSLKGNWIILPKPLYIGIVTKQSRLSEAALQKVSLKFEDF